MYVELSKVMYYITISSSEQDIKGGYRVGTYITSLRSWEHTNDRKPAVWDVRLRGGQCWDNEDWRWHHSVTASAWRDQGTISEQCDLGEVRGRRRRGGSQARDSRRTGARSGSGWRPSLQPPSSQLRSYTQVRQNMLPFTFILRAPIWYDILIMLLSLSYLCCSN